MPDLIIRPSERNKDKPYALELRFHDCCGPTEYQSLCHVNEETARNIIEAGKAEWLFGDPRISKSHKTGKQP